MSNRFDGDMPSAPHQGPSALDTEGNGIGASVVSNAILPTISIELSAEIAASASLQANDGASSSHGPSHHAAKSGENRNSALQSGTNAQLQDNTCEQKNTHASTPSLQLLPVGSPIYSRQSQFTADFNRPCYAALDLGTNNCRLLVASPTKPGRFRVVDSFSRIVRLGEGLGATGQLSEAAMTRAVDALVVCAAKLKCRPIRKIRLIATEACRAAINGEAFLERVKSRTGLNLEIIDRETEAKLAVAGCAPLVANNAPGAVLFDIGGGSTEVILCDLRNRRGRRLDNNIAAWTSLPVGVVTLAEKFGGQDVNSEIYQAMVDHVLDLINDFGGRNALGELANHADFHLLGTSGTVTTLAGLLLGLERYDRRQVDGLWVTAQEIDDTTNTLRSWNFETRVANACIGPDRADLVLAGCAILDAIRIIWPSTRLRVADRGLREGVLMNLMAADGAWRNNRFQQKHTNAAGQGA